VTYSKQLIEINVSSLLFFRWSSVLLIIKSGNDRYHQVRRVVEYPQQAQRELSPNKKADGVLGMIKAIGTSNFSLEFSLKAWRMNSISARIVSLIK